VIVRKPLLLAVIVALALPAAAETIYFKNKRTIEASSYEIKGNLIWLTMANGKKVYLRADSVDWEGTQQIQDRDYRLMTVDYDLVDGPQEGDEDYLANDGRPLTAADLRRVGSGLRVRRVSSPTLVVEVDAALPWVDSRINVRFGQRMVLRATGEVDLGGMAVGANGSESGSPSKRLVAEFPHGALLMRIGLGGTPALAGRQADLPAPASGRLYLVVNDRDSTDNSGSYQVRVKLPVAGSSGTMSSGASLAPPPRSSSGSAPPRAPARGMVGSVDKARATRDQVSGGQ